LFAKWTNSQIWYATGADQIRLAESALMRQRPCPLLKASMVEYDLVADATADLTVDEVSVEFVPVGDGGVADEGVIDFLP